MARKKKVKWPKNEEEMAEHLKSFPKECPRKECKSTNIQFKFFNNHKIYQPRYRCENCTKFFTLGGLRGCYKKNGTNENKINLGDEEVKSESDEDGAAEKCKSGRNRTMRLPNTSEAKKLKAAESSSEEDDGDDDEMPEINSEDGDDDPQNPNSDEDEDDDPLNSNSDEDEDEDGSGRVRARRRASRSWGRSKTAKENSISEEDDGWSLEDEDDKPWSSYEPEDEDTEPGEEKGHPVGDGGRGEALCDEDQVGTRTGHALKRIKVKLVHAPVHVDEKVHDEENDIMLLDDERRQQYLQDREAYEREEFIQHDRALREEMRLYKVYKDYRPILEQALAAGGWDVGRKKGALKEKALNHLDDALVACNEIHFEAHFMALTTKWRDCWQRVIRENREMFESETMKQSLRFDLKEFVSEWADTSTFTSDRYDRMVAFEIVLRKAADDVSRFWDEVDRCVVKRDSVHSVSHSEIEMMEKEARKLAGAVLDVVRHIG